MDMFRVNGVRISGIVACLPEVELDNHSACAELYGDGIDTLIKATGIHSRVVAAEGTTALDLNVYAAKELLNKTNTLPDEIGAVVNVTFTPEYLMPADSPSAQNRLGIPKYCMAFDINMACSGYGYGVYIASLLVNSLNKKVLLLNGDVQSKYVSTYDKATVPVLADIGTATLLSPSSIDREWVFSFYTDGSGREALFIPAGGAKSLTNHEDLEFIQYDDGSRRRNIDIFMDGFEIFRFVAMDVSKFIIQFMKENNIDDDNIDVFVPHQANIYMISQLTKKLKISQSKMWKSGDIYGNPASASIPLTIAKNAKAGFVNADNISVLLAGFGGGLSIGVGKLMLSKSAVYEVVRYEKGGIA